VFVGRLVSGKGWEAVLDATAILYADAEVPAFSVDILGDGPDRARLLARIKETGLDSVVTSRGHLEGPELLEAMRGCVLVNPTTLSEGFQTSLIEALACHCQIVTFDVPGARMLSEDGAPVFIVNEATAESLAAVMRSAILAPRPLYRAELMHKWGWESRAFEYAQIVNESREKYAAENS
jgi:glycosyltransferase involved in cell wall biosynthesis